jgi:thiol-disulfide isomerase/thioredoxin
MSLEHETTIQDPPRRNPLILAGGFTLLVGLAALIFSGNLSGSAGSDVSDPVAPSQSAPIQLPTGGDPLQVGDIPYEFALQDLQGNTVQLSDFIGQPVLINFWATWCGPCRIEMPELQEAFETYADDGLVILALDQDETPEVVQDFFSELDLTFLPVLDEGKLAAERYGTFGSLPSSYFVNPEGEITVIHRGPMVREQLETYLAQTIPGMGEA